MKGSLIKRLIKKNKKWSLTIFNTATDKKIVVGEFDSFKEAADSLKDLIANSRI